MSYEKPPAAYDLYDLLRALVEKVNWPVEEEKRLAIEAIELWRGMGIFGQLMLMAKCPHPEDVVYRGRCTDCGSVVMM